MDTAALEVWCPTCGAKPGESCRSLGIRKPRDPHDRRRYVAHARNAPPALRPAKKLTATLPWDVRQAVRARCHGQCEANTPACTQWGHPGAHHHHKLPRSLGGQHTAENLLYVCSRAHDYIHAHPEESFEHGWLVHSWDAA